MKNSSRSRRPNKGDKEIMRDSASCVLLTLLCFVPLHADAAEPSEKAVARPSKGEGGKTGVFANEELEVNGDKREYRLIVPKNLDPKGGPLPLVFAFHGLFDSKDLMPFYSQLDKLAEASGFILVYPNGKNKCWPLVVEWAKN